MEHLASDFSIGTTATDTESALPEAGARRASLLAMIAQACPCGYFEKTEQKETTRSGLTIAFKAATLASRRGGRSGAPCRAHRAGNERPVVQQGVDGRLNAASTIWWPSG